MFLKGGINFGRFFAKVLMYANFIVRLPVFLKEVLEILNNKALYDVENIMWP